jgi:hypothetical protein
MADYNSNDQAGSVTINSSTIVAIPAVNRVPQETTTVTTYINVATYVFRGWKSSLNSFVYWTGNSVNTAYSGGGAPPTDITIISTYYSTQ